jgi:glycosyltransferase involved in cell wall biosynthesis
MICSSECLNLSSSAISAPLRELKRLSRRGAELAEVRGYGIINPKRKICIASMAPFLGGAEVAAERLALGLQQAGYEVVLLLGKKGEVLDRFERAGLRCIYASMCFTDKWHWWRYTKARNRLRHVLRQERPDVVHSNDLPTNQIVSDAARGLGIPRLCHHRFVFDPSAIDWFNKFGAERHIFISRAVMQDLCSKSVQLKRSTSAIVYDGIPVPREPDREQRQQVRKRLGLPNDRPIVTFAGQIIKIKGVADLIQAWARLEDRWKEIIELLVIGEDFQNDGKYRVEMQQMAAAVGCPARFLGFQENVGQWLLASDIAVVPSHVEPLSLATLEAMSYALPVIGCAVGGIPEIIMHDQTGLLIPPQNPEQLAAALTRLLNDEPLRHRLGEQGRKRCEAKFSLNAHVTAVVEQYEHIIREYHGAQVITRA